jgi:hypothetical protein
LTGLSPANVRYKVEQSIVDYFAANTGKFSQVFRQSNLLTEVDATDTSVLSSRANIILSRDVTPQTGTIRNYIVDFPVAIRDPEVMEVKTVYTSPFSVGGQTVAIRNKLDQRYITDVGEFELRPSTTLEMYVVDTGEILNDAVGFYNTVTGNVTIESVNIESVPGSKTDIKIFAVPANQSVVGSLRNNIIKHDTEYSFTQAIIVSTR